MYVFVHDDIKLKLFTTTCGLVITFSRNCVSEAVNLISYYHETGDDNDTHTHTHSVYMLRTGLPCHIEKYRYKYTYKYKCTRAQRFSGAHTYTHIKN